MTSLTLNEDILILDILDILDILLPGSGERQVDGAEEKVRDAQTDDKCCGSVTPQVKTSSQSNNCHQIT